MSSMPRIRSLRLGTAVGALAFAAALAGCGKVGSPDIPPGSTYPKVYPANAIRPTQPQQAQAPTTGSAFTASGAWIDPAQRLILVDPYADIDQKGAGGLLGSSEPTPTPAGTAQPYGSTEGGQ